MADIHAYRDALSAVHTTAKYTVGTIFTAPGAKKYVYGKIRLGTVAATTPRDSVVVPIRGTVASSAWVPGEFTTSVSYTRGFIKQMGGVSLGRVTANNSYCLVQVGGLASVALGTSAPIGFGKRVFWGESNKTFRKFRATTTTISNVASGTSRIPVGYMANALTTGTSNLAQLITIGKRAKIFLLGNGW